jgi:hypothetical protein
MSVPYMSEKMKSRYHPTKTLVSEHLATSIRARFPSADLGYVTVLLSVAEELSRLSEARIRDMIQIPQQSLGQLYVNLLAGTFFSHPFEPPTKYRSQRFLSLPLTFSIHDEHVEHLLTRRTWHIFGNIGQYLHLTGDSATYVARCRRILGTHILFESISNTCGTIHVLPAAISCDDTGIYCPDTMSACLPFEFTFRHTLYHKHFNYHHSQLSRRRTPLEQILDHASYPIGRSIGTFYRSAEEQVVLVSPSEPTCVGRIVTDNELDRIESLRCSFLHLAPGINPCVLLCSVIHAIQNPDDRESYLLVPDNEIPFWHSVLHTHDLILLPFSMLAQRTLPPAHLLIIDEAHQLPPRVLPIECRHLIGMSSNLSAHWKHMMQICGIGELSCPPLEPERDLCIYPPNHTG